MPNQSAQLNDVFNALADPTQRAVLERLSRGPASMTELAQPHAMALPSCSQHLHVLERRELVRSRKRERVRTYRLSSRPLQAVEHWLESHDERMTLARREWLRVMLVSPCNAQTPVHQVTHDTQSMSSQGLLKAETIIIGRRFPRWT